MELFKEILINILAREGIQSSLQDLDMIVVEAIESECCRSLEKIRAILDDQNLSDFQCIKKIRHVCEKTGAD